MKFFSSFDTKLKSKYITDLSELYGEENIVLITRSNFYFLKKVAVHIILWIFTYMLCVMTIYGLVWIDAAMNYGIRIALPFSLIFFVIASENYIDYAMNYAIFTPHEAILVEQLWFFKRNIRSLDVKKIKSISIRKSNRIFSLFDDGLLSILNEGSHSSNNMWEIIFKYVHQPEIIKERIHHVISTITPSHTDEL